ncbi:MAG: DNA internalization-related competence protein ComEC/Rec2 [Vicinamibacterales bacterium]
MALALGVLSGACLGVFVDVPAGGLWIALGIAVVAVLVAARATLAAAVLVFACGGALLATTDRRHALHSTLRTVLDDRYGGFLIDSLGPEGVHPPVLTRAILTEDASSDPPGAQMRARVVAIQLEGEWRTVDGGVSVSIGGDVPAEAILRLRAGRTVTAPLTFRRPARYLNPGVPDFERSLAMNGTTLFASAKSALLIDVISPGLWRQERAADVRALVRRASARWVRPHSAISDAIVTAVLIGDRTALPDDVRERLQAAGVYHVLAISGGNIAILVGCVLLLCRCIALSGRTSTAATMALLMVYAQVVVAGPSVFRAVLMAMIYLAARLIDHRAPPWQAIAVAVATTVALDPLDVVDAGFLLTFAATAALLGVVPFVARLRPYPAILRWLLAAVLASLATEVVLLPVGASAFSRVTVVGILLNLVAIPLMTIVQLAGFALGLGAFSEAAGEWAGWIAHQAASALVGSTRLVDVLPWLTTRTPPPPPLLVLLYYLTGGIAIFLRDGRRFRAAAIAAIIGAAIVTGAWLVPEERPRDQLRLTMFDVGQGEAMHIEWPGGGSMLVDTGGAPFGGGGFDIGDRVLRPALWARGVRHVERLLVTHGDPDHIGGARAIVESFSPEALLEGIPVPRNVAVNELRAESRVRGTVVREVRAGDEWRQGDAVVRVLSPEVPDWERPKVRNDDSVVLEVRYRDVAILLTGDISADVERQLVKNWENGVGGHLKRTPAIRILKVAHHGSRTSTSDALIDAWRPQFALISCGRGNRFGHPAPDVIARLERAGVDVYRTDRDGAITLTTDGRTVSFTPALP